MAIEGVRVIHIPNLASFLSQRHPRFPYEKSWASEQTEPLLVVETAGTSGRPRPVVYTHEWLASSAREVLLKGPAEFENVEQSEICGKRVLLLMLHFQVSLTETYP